MIALLFVDKDYSTSMMIMEIQLKIKSKYFIDSNFCLPYCWWGLNIGWNTCGIVVCIDGLINQPPRELTIVGGDWWYCPYDNGIDVGHNGRFVGITFVDDGIGGEGDEQVLSIHMNIILKI